MPSASTGQHDSIGTLQLSNPIDRIVSIVLENMAARDYVPCKASYSFLLSPAISLLSPIRKLFICDEDIGSCGGISHRTRQELENAADLCTIHLCIVSGDIVHVTDLANTDRRIWAFKGSISFLPKEFRENVIQVLKIRCFK